MNKINGHIRNIFKTCQPNNRQFRQFWVTTEEQNPQDIRFQVSDDKCNELDSFKVGDFIEVKFVMSGKAKVRKGETEESLYNNNNAIEINRIIEE